MRKSILFFVGLLLIAGLCIGTVSAYDQPSQDGQGNWLIGTVSNLQWFAEQVNAGHASYNAKLISDIDLSGVTWTPIGTSTYAYAGTFDGNGKTIKNINIGTASVYQDWKGLFSYTNNAEIKNLIVSNCNIYSSSTTQVGTYCPVGLLIQSASSGEVSNCYFEDITIKLNYDNHISALGIVAGSANNGFTVSNCEFINCNLYCYGMASVVVGGCENANSGYANIYNTVGYNCLLYGLGSQSYKSTGFHIGWINRNTANIKSNVIISSSFDNWEGNGNNPQRIGGAGTQTDKNNYVSDDTTVSGWTVSSDKDGSDGATTSLSLLKSQSYYSTPNNWGDYQWDFANTWYWDTTTNLPKLQVFNPSTPSISSITVTSSSPAPVGSRVIVEVELENTPATDLGNVHVQSSIDGATWTWLSSSPISSQVDNVVTITYTGQDTANNYLVNAILDDTTQSITYNGYAHGIYDQVRLVTTPTLSDISISQSIGKLQTAYTPTITIPITGLGGAQTVYLKAQEYNSQESRWDDTDVSGTTTATGSKTLTLSVNDNTATTHQYRVLVSSLSDYTASVTATSNTVTFQTFAPPATPTAEINPSTITINTQTAITLNATSYPTAPAGNAYTYQWKYGDSSTPSAGDTNITTAETTLTNPATWNVNFPSTGTKYVYLQITDSLSQTKYSQSQTLTITNIQASVVWATTYHGMSDNINLVINGHQLGNSYTWYYQDTTGTEWTQIGTTYSYNYVKTPSQMGLTSGHTYRFKAVFNGVDLTAQNTLTPYESPIPATPGAPLQPIAIPYTITLTASVTNPATVDSYKWQIQNGASWQDVSTGEQYSTAINNPGNYVYRFVAIGKNGYSVNSDSVTVQAGYAPSARITAPETGSQYDAGARINVGATVGGTQATYTWNFGDGTQSTGTTTGTINEQSTTISSYVQYTKVKGSKTITLTVSNIYGTSATYTIHVENGKSSMRPTATGTVTPVDSSGIYNLINNTAPQSASNPLPNMSGMISDLTKPITSIIGEWFYLLIFAVPYLIIFLRQKNILIPSILGVLFAGFLFIMLPGVAMKASIGILILSIAGGVFGLYVKRHS